VKIRVLSKKHVGLGVAIVALAVLVTAFAMNAYWTAKVANFYGNVGIDLVTRSIHASVKFYKDGELVFESYHPGNVTDIGDNQTLAWVFGDDDYNVTSYLKNSTYISIGNMGILNESSTVLPGEWNRTSGTIKNETGSQLNITCTFEPDAGPYTADCIGINWEPGIGVDGNLWASDIFNEVTGIDDTFTIDVEFQISVSDS